MMREIPFLSSSTELNTISDYERFRNVKAYLASKNPIYFKSDVRWLAATCGYDKESRIGSFNKHIGEWMRLERKIPIAFLKGVGVRLDTLREAEELDQEEYDQTVALPFFPSTITMRLMAAVYTDTKLPPGTTEEAAIEILIQESKEKHRSCCIVCPGIKTIYANPDGEVGFHYSRPKLLITEDWVEANADFTTRIGKAYLW